jgi:multidrug transporter EmrE-like cation transporter
MNAYVFLSIALLLNAAANLLIKFAANRAEQAAAAGTLGTGLAGVVATYLNPYFVAGLLCFGLNVLIYSQALKKIPISVAYPVMVSLGYLIILAVSFFLFEEKLTAPRYLGAGLMLFGLWLLVR